MWRIPAPARTALWTYERCISGVRDAALRGRLASVTGDIAAAADAFKTAVQSGTVVAYPPAAHVGAVTGDELRSVYTSRFARSKSRGRVVYDEIMSAADNGRCPMCGHRQVASLDHYLPKALFPALCVAPDNLVPACSDCNKGKLDAVAATPSEVMLHPYFDDVESDPWLVAEVGETAPPSVRFYVDAPAGWSQELADRVSSQFTKLKLGRLYASQAAEELLNLQQALKNLFAVGGAAAVAAHLAEFAASCRAHRVNSWQTAMYAAIADSQWFCDGGFA